MKINIKKLSQNSLQLSSSNSPNSLDIESDKNKVKDRKLNPATGEYSFQLWSKAFESQPNEFNYEFSDIEPLLRVTVKHL